MAFSNFKNVQHVIQMYPLQLVHKRLVPDTQMELPAPFLEDLDFSLIKR